MLRELSIENFALIESLVLDFGPGFTVLTGETGAGKSIIIDALNAVLGGRVGSDMIRGGESAARIEAVFDAGGAPAVLAAMDETGLREGDDTTVIFTRDIQSGRSTYRINRRTATGGMLQELGRHLVDIHGQHEHQTLIHEENHLEFLDAFGGQQYGEALEVYRREYEAYRKTTQALADLKMDDRDRAQRADMLRFQVAEIDAAELEADEEERLGAERSRLQHAEKILETVARTCELLDGESEGISTLAAVQVAEQELRSLAAFDDDLGKLADEIDTASVVLQEAARTLGGYLQELEADPQRLEQVESRLAEIGRLKRKYGDSVPELLAFREKCAAELHELENVETREETLQAELQRARRAAGGAGERLSAARTAAAEQLEAAVEDELQDLGMEAARFRVELSSDEDPEGVETGAGRRLAASRRGIDRCRFVFSANAGEALRPLAKVASGGELSRLMLAFKSVCARGAATPTIIFDEVDTGIGGRVAHAVGEKLVRVSATAQVLCVTHLAQIARLADRHVHIEKQVREGRTVVTAAVLSPEARVGEIARMLGAQATDVTAHRHAGELLAAAQEDRGRLRGGDGGACA